MKYIINFMILLSLNIIFSLYAGSTITDPSVELNREKIVYAVCDTDNWPYEFINEKGEPDGFSVELFQMVMKHLGLKYQIKPMSWGDLSENMDSCLSTVYIGVSFSPDRSERTSFSMPYASGTISIVSREGDNYKEINDLVGKRIIFKKREKIYDIAQKSNLCDTIIAVTSIKEALDMLSEGKGDAFVGTTAVTQKELEKSGINTLVINTADIAPYNYSLAVDINERKLLNGINEALYSLMLSGKYNALHDKWLRDQKESIMPDDIKYSIIAGFAIILILISFVIILRRQVRLMTKHLRKAKEEAEHNDFMKSVFLANMGKELMNPLSAIVGFSNILATETDEKEKQKYLTLIDSNSNQLVQLINTVVDLSKFEAGVMTLSKMSFDINTLCKDMVTTRIDKCRLDDIKLHLDTDGDIEVNSDQQKICQAIDALLENAAKLTPQGDITLQTRREGDFVKVSVIDNGTGISEAHLDKIFERYTKLDNHTDSSELNLALFKAIIKSLGGEIGAVSKVGEGSTFWFKLKINNA